MLKEIDIGHAGQNSSNAISDLEVAISTAKSDPRITAVKIIHGLGSGKVAKEVRRWAKEQTGRFRGVINGEDYDMFNRDAVDMRSDFLSTKDEDFNRRNPGITIIWL
ncbi:MAG: hypothetical protein ACKVLG_00345 [Fidelibacterota bacterium]|jgi:hypothetical protein|nr:hypothetical protein [Paracoccaceae bacterium]MBT6867485.1 hypothetical protein [Candidatus Neomarinimicrobiota bacterium]MBT7172535.1 hypothetical protein [Candidatus Neomarinimicrobiota bacterium]|tara:strand:- start:901 stop:1221 length:321 start_codon:yes stop_codon:yes gene_type:complete